MKIRNLLSLFTFTIITSTHVANAQEASYEQLTAKKNKVKISFELYCDDEHAQSEPWQKIETQVKDLIDRCYAGPDKKIDEIFQETYKTIECIRNEQRTDPSQGIKGILNVTVGEPASSAK